MGWQRSVRMYPWLVALVALSVVTCSFDERPVVLDGSGGSAPANPGSDGTSQEVDGLQGLSGAGGILSVDSDSLDFGPVALDTVSLGSIRAINAGTAPMDAPSVALAADGSPDFVILQNLCTAPLEPKAGCQIRVQFQPTQAAAQVGVLSLSTRTGDALSVSLSGVGLAVGDLVLSPDAASSPNFGNVVVGSVREATFALINQGEAASGLLTLNLRNPEFQLQPPADGDCISETTSLPQGGSCNIRVAFVPTRPDELAAATLTVGSADVGGTSLNLTGVALAPAELGVGAQVAFGSVVLGQSGRGTVTLQNLGDEPLAVPAVTIEGADGSSFTVLENQCGSELAAKSSCDLSVEFQPTRPDAHTAEVVLTSSAGDTTRVALVGQGLQPGALLISAADAMAPSEFDFGAVVVGSSAPPLQTFLVTNSGGTPSGALGIDVVNISGGSFALPGDNVAGDCIPGATSLESGQSCNVRVLYQPSDRGFAQGSLTITSDLAGSSGLQLRGTGLLPAKLVLVTPNLIQFGQVITSSTTPAVVTLRNDGDQALDPLGADIVPTGGGLPAEFFIADNGCSMPLESQATCSLRVELKPTQPGSHSASLLLSAGAAGTQSIGLTARAVLPGTLAVDPPTATFVALVAGQSDIQTFTLSNPGADSGPLRFNTSSADFELQTPRAGSTDCVFNQTRLAEGQTCTVRVLFDPELRGTGLLATLQVASPNAGSDSVQFTATAQAPALLAGSQTNQFGTVVIGASSRFTWTVRNDGDVTTGPLQLGVTPAMTGDYRTETNGCAAGLAPQSSCSLVVVFEPKTQNDPAAPLAASFTLQGTGVSLILRVTGSGRQVQQPGQRCTGNDSLQCARAGDVCSFNHNLAGGGAICCNSACTNPCDTCNATGTCAPKGDGASCGTNQACRGELCLKQNAQSCVLGTECASANCEPNRDICCAQACAVGQRCTANGMGCEVNPQPNGTGCNTAAQCSSGNCVDGVCCNSPCNGACQACNSPSAGVCSFSQAEVCPVAGQVCSAATSQCAFSSCVVGVSRVGQCVLAAR